MTHGDGGKGSGRRQEDASKVRDNWDLIFKPKGQTMNEHDEHDHDDDDGSEEEVVVEEDDDDDDDDDDSNDKARDISLQT
jgi:hypothetical protein